MGAVAKGNRKGCAKDTRTESIMKYGTIFHGCAGKRDRNILRAQSHKATRRFADIYFFLFIYLYARLGHVRVFFSLSPTLFI